MITKRTERMVFPFDIDGGYMSCFYHKREKLRKKDSENAKSLLHNDDFSNMKISMDDYTSIEINNSGKYIDVSFITDDSKSGNIDYMTEALKWFSREFILLHMLITENRMFRYKMFLVFTLARCSALLFTIILVSIFCDISMGWVAVINLIYFLIVFMEFRGTSFQRDKLWSELNIIKEDIKNLEKATTRNIEFFNNKTSDNGNK